VHLGIVTPVVSLNPRFETPQWELDGGMDEVVALSQAADRFGYRWMGCPEHVAVPVKAAGQRGGRYWDPVVTLSYVAAQTTSIHLVPHVVVLGYHHPLTVVKRYGSLDVASGGRVILSVGVGSLRREFQLLGVPFEGRGEIADDAIAAIRASFGRSLPEHDGPHFQFRDMVVEPSGLNSDVTIWVGGLTRRSLRRALELGDGWIPFGLTLEQLGDMLGRPDVAEARASRADSFDVVLAPEPPLDPVDDPDGALARVQEYIDIGATGLALRFVHRSLDHYIEQLEAMVHVMAGAGIDLT
jgi:probable F420-dependent oxidoreductase